MNQREYYNRIELWNVPSDACENDPDSSNSLLRRCLRHKGVLDIVPLRKSVISFQMATVMERFHAEVQQRFICSL